MDSALIRTLHSDGRAPWPRVARDLGCSPSTARRRFEAMHRAGLLRLIGRADVVRLGLGVPAMVQFTGVDANSPEFVEAIRTRSDVRFLASVIGSAASVSEFVVPDAASLQRRLSDIAADFRVTADTFVVLHTYTSGQDWLPDSVERHVDTRSGNTDQARLATAEVTVLELLVRDGRTSLADIAAAIDKSEHTARRTIDSLRERELLDFRVLVEPAALGFDSEFWIWLDVEPSTLAQVGEELASNPATKYLAVTAGRSNLAGQIVLPAHSAMFAYVTDVLGKVDGVRRLETLIQTETHKRVWHRVADGRYIDPPPTVEFSSVMGPI